MKYDVIVIGAGQAGLSMGYHLSQTKLSYVLLDKGSEVGESWKTRYDSLTLFTPRSYSSLPGLPLLGDDAVYPTKDEVASYLRTYSDVYSLPIEHHTQVERLSKTNDGFEIITNKRIYTSRYVIVATGPFQQPFIPSFSSFLSKDILQLHSSAYQNPSQLKEGSVLVVGGGNSGAQIAVELAEHRNVFLSVGHKLKFLPMNIGKTSIFRIFDKVGILRAKSESKLGKMVRKRPDPIFGYELKTLLKNKKISLKPKTLTANEHMVTFSDNSSLSVDNVIWCTGFKPDYQWMNIPHIVDEKGIPIHQRGLTSTKGLYFLGLPWQVNRASALLGGVGDDASTLIQDILSHE